MTKIQPRDRHVSSLASGSSTTKMALVFTTVARLVHGMPVAAASAASSEEEMTSEQLYINLLVSAFLVLAGGVFAGLTLGLMGQDEVYLKVIATSGEAHERKHARKVLNLIGKGKHWVLVTLLLSNVITNETLPIVLDRCLGGGWPAVVTSTASIVVFGEIIPQSICVRYGLQVGALFAPFVLFLMYVMYPVAYPCALLLDYILGEDHGTVYKKSGLKTLVTLHRTMGVERLNQDEVTIISAVLDLKEKPVSQIMTPINRVYTMPSNKILDEKTVEEIFNAGFSRIPIHIPGEPMNFVGMLLVRVLISYDPEDALPVALFPLATLPETAADTSCLNILNYFQEGKSHMIVVSETPGEPTGSLGVLTLEDVIEELIGEEIVDESDVYIDINKNIKRENPGPLYKRNLTAYLHNLYQSGSKKNSLDMSPEDASNTTKSILKAKALSASPNRMRNANVLGSPMLAPVNPAANPLETSKSFVKIKRPAPSDPASGPFPIDREILLGDKKANPETYNEVFSSEREVLDEARANQKAGNDASFIRRTLSDLTELDHTIEHARNTNNAGNGNTLYLEPRSYRTGGIVESIVNVQGVHKTIIEDITEDEESEPEYGAFNGSRNKRVSHGEEEMQRLISFR
ncbi:DUF21-domain-containing protein [Metschnikowia bicuspidata var. bicuspidata NRRL YB-4993]|uniref:DUF21-domain-containing protein n=1 Tax=Metschnikowia bicuspidata var. bicuspidata NRRL YB-4993 TaxID=869754 RepID=A0A1A0H7R2_9ASCO|nr:DUF21-domain-containing protein [Metschnikowia bicuspidata var. bicuspidata NRRL YB-4993]OBA19938.1 DUF21-domain-containing protein [Metschnikowia bicuspidata var. bicuspidata NRRL YB-4993]